MTIIHNLGFPRIGQARELKFALERYWAGEIDRQALFDTGEALRRKHWALQAQAGLAFVPVGDFAWYDPLLSWSATLGVVPARFGQDDGAPVDLDTMFRMARGKAPTGTPAAACEMTKWFDTNYHAIVPELVPGQRFRIAAEDGFAQIDEAQVLGHAVKPVIPGPLTWLWLAKGPAFSDGAGDVRKLALLPELLAVYRQVLVRMAGQGVQWVQLDEPILVLDLPDAWRKALRSACEALAGTGLRLLLTTYFEGLRENVALLPGLPVDGIHVDLARAPDQLDAVLAHLDPHCVLSAGVIDGRNVWRADIAALAQRLRPVHERLGERLWLAPSCSLQHVPMDLAQESGLDQELRQWLSFAVQKLEELRLLADALDGRLDAQAAQVLQAHQAGLEARRSSPRIHRPAVAQAVADASALPRGRAPFSERHPRQQARLALPPLPTTTIGSFPQTPALRRQRRAWREGNLSDAAYTQEMQAEITRVIRAQEEIGLDVLVHGEPERNDMVEYFGELLAGFAFTEQGWVLSYGSRCVKPPIIFGDVSRPAPMTIHWIRYAQSLTEKPVKGMLTGPVTLLQWSFVRDDQPRDQTCRQLALALREEVLDLEAAGVAIIQIDEPALREGLPLRRADWPHYLAWASECFRLATSAVAGDTQIHTHMCYSEFNDIIDAIAGMDADVITMETARSNMALLDAFRQFHYPNDIGPGVYDIHSPNVPEVQDMVALMRKAMQYLPRERLWVNPDCGLKTRSWPQVSAGLTAMVSAAHALRYTS